MGAGTRSGGASAIGVVLLFLMLQSEHLLGAEYVVGDGQGWDLNPDLFHWGKGKHFKAGDVLVFKYSNPLFGVVAVDREGYQNCDHGKGHAKKFYSSGNDHVVLNKGPTYFICHVIDYCGYGMRIAVTAQ